MDKKYSLYYTLNSDISNDKIDAKKKKELKEKLSSLTKEQNEAVFLLIVEHNLATKQMDNIDISKFIPPYGGRIQDKSIEFDIDKFPNELLCILLKFLKIIQK
jgi:hypothetical protein